MNKAEERAHILQGLLIALDNIDEVIHIIRSSPNVSAAKEALIERFALTEVQAQAIVDMRLRALTGLEREKLEAEYKELMEKIAELKAILADEKKLLTVIRNEISLIAEKYGDDRRTSIGYDEYDISMEDLIPKSNTVIAMTKLGYIKRMSVDNFRSQNRGGKGVKCYKITEKTGDVIGMKAVNEDDEIMMINSEGIIIRMSCADISKLGRITSGVKLINLKEDEKVVSLAKVRKASAEIDGEEIEIEEDEEEVSGEIEE